MVEARSGGGPPARKAALPLPDGVEVLAPSGLLQRKFAGNSVRSLLNPATERSALASVETLRENIERVLGERLTEIETLVRAREGGSAAGIYAAAHEIRGLAGTFQMEELGIAANLLCQYLDGAPPDHRMDPDLVTSIAVTARHCMAQAELGRKGGRPDRQLMAELLSECRQAVGVVRQREGRAEPAADHAENQAKM